MNFCGFARGLVLAAVLACVGAFSATAAPNLVQNGSFEDGYPGDNVCGINWYEVGYDCNLSDSSIPGWLQTGGGVDWHDNTSDPLEPAAQDGLHTIDLIGFDDAGAIEQGVTTTPGSLYALSFWYAGHPACVMTNGTDTASAMAAAGDASMTVTSGPTNNYTRVALAFTAMRETTAICFRSLTSFGCGGVLIDNVSVDPMTRDACVREGWQSFGVFKNQGDCVSFVATRGANRPGGA